MKKDKEIKPKPVWSQWKPTPNFLRNLLVFLILLVILFFSIVIIKKRYSEKKVREPVCLVRPSPSNQATLPALNLSALPSQEDLKLLSGRLAALENKINQVQQVLQNPQKVNPPAPSQEELKALSDRLVVLENKMNQAQQILQSHQKIMAVELLHGVLKGKVPLGTFRAFLQKKPEPWAKTLLATLASVKECKTYPQLDALLVLSPSQSFSVLERIKRKIKSLIHIRKLDQNGDHTTVQLEDVRRAIYDHDIQRALGSFEKLPPEEKAQLSLWKELAQSRLTLETISNKLLLELAES